MSLARMTAPRIGGSWPSRHVGATLAVAVALAVASGVLSAPAVASAATGYPRLGMWWPNNDTQPAAERARYDWIQLQNTDAHHIAELRALNPDIIVLAATNARELTWSLSGYDHAHNVELRRASTDWILTQAGSTLTGAVTIASTTIPVADTSRFRAGEVVLCDRELMYVVSRSAESGPGSLSVQRGKFNPAASHAAGARIAAVCTTFDNCIEFDITASCPKVDAGYGPETWRDWNVRRGHDVIHSADWDGVFIDCYDDGVHWWVSQGYVRSIDRNRDNVPDDLESTSTAWRAGMLAYGTALKAAAGDDLVVSNGHGFQNDDLNGTNFESYPTTWWTYDTWKAVIIGPWNVFPKVSYLYHTQNDAQPNLTTMDTYGAQTDYQRMRFGLATALMADGYYSYTLGYAHGRDGLWWYDEYDNAGVGRGYLGQPLGAAAEVVSGGVGTRVWRRDYQGGVALVNPDTVARTVSLGGTFRKIRGTQDPTVNSGALVTQVTLQSRDGIILLRTTDAVPPTTTLTAGSAAPLRWYKASVALTVKAVDTGEGVHEVYLDRGAGVETVPNSFTFTLSGEGDRTIRYWAKDKVGNVESAKSTKVGIDLTPPTVSSNAQSAPYTGAAVIQITGSDALSGMGGFEYRVNGGAAQSGSSVTLQPSTYPATYQLDYRARDAAGNWSDWSAPKTITVDQPAHVPLHRFYNLKTGTHFYTASEVEREKVATTLVGTYRYEGVSYHVSLASSEGPAVHRFYNLKTGTHFYTASEVEREKVATTLASTYRYEGVAFHAAASGALQGTIPVYRFHNIRTGTHFYTMSDSERDTVIATLGSTYLLEGTAYHAWSR